MSIKFKELKTCLKTLTENGNLDIVFSRSLLWLVGVVLIIRHYAN